MTFNKREIARRRTPGPWFKYPSNEFVGKFSSDHHVLAFANMFGVGGRDHRFHGMAPLKVKEGCRGFLRPSVPIQETAHNFVNSFLGQSYAAMHLRRGDFFEHCMHGHGSTRQVPCFMPLAQVAQCIHRR